MGTVKRWVTACLGAVVRADSAESPGSIVHRAPAIADAQAASVVPALAGIAALATAASIAVAVNAETVALLAVSFAQTMTGSLAAAADSADPLTRAYFVQTGDAA